MTKTRFYTVASCATGCAFHSLLSADTACRMCDGPMTGTKAVTRDQMLALIRNEDAYQAGKRAHLAAVGITI